MIFLKSKRLFLLPVCLLLMGCSVGSMGGGGGGGKSSSSNSGGDSFEADNTAAAAKTITVDAAAQNHTLSSTNDVDWVKFTASQTVLDYTITCAAGSDILDMDLYSAGNYSVPIDSGLVGSPIVFLPSLTGVYYIRIKPNGTNSGSYTIAVTKDTTPKRIEKQINRKRSIN
jgi:hypothetical protein